jgi:hypothetical protein
VSIEKVFLRLRPTGQAGPGQRASKFSAARTAAEQHAGIILSMPTRWTGMLRLTVR